MESIGERLRAAREAKKLSIKDVVKATNISPIYLVALEDEDFDKFPSETYLIGFLRGYAEFLKLDPEEIIQSYRGYKIGESTTPIEELTRPTKSPAAALFSSVSGHFKIVLVAVALFVLVGGLFLGVRMIMSTGVDISASDSVEKMKKEYEAEKKEGDIENIRPLQLSNDKGFILVYKNEAVQFMVGTKEVIFLLKDITPNGDQGKVTVEYLPDKKEQVFSQGTETSLEVDELPRKVYFTLMGLTENRAKIKVVLSGEDGTAETKKEEITDTVEDTTKVIAQNKESLKIIFQASFVQKSYVELYLDGQLKKRGFVPGGTVERWEATEYIQIKIGNAGGIKARINGRDYSFGKAGEVANKVITWQKDNANPNLYTIVVRDW